MTHSLHAWLRPGMWGWHAFAIIAIAGCVIAGFWQLGVYGAQQEDKRAEQMSRPVVPLTDVWGPDEPMRADLLDRRVTVTGTFADPGEQVWVAGREDNGRTGYWLLAPLRVGGGSHALLVVRGWSPDPGSMPDVPGSSVSVTAVLQQGESAAEPLNADRVIGSVRVPALLNVLDVDLYDGFGISTDTPAALRSQGLEQAEVPDPDVSWTVGVRNLAYATQWWAFAVFGAYMWWRIGRDLVAGQRSGQHASPGGNDTLET